MRREVLRAVCPQLALSVQERSTVVSTVKDTRTRNLSDKQTTLCACTAETARLP